VRDVPHLHLRSPHTTLYLSSYYYVCVLILLICVYVCTTCHTRPSAVVILLFMCPRTTMCPHTTIYVYMCVRRASVFRVKERRKKVVSKEVRAVLPKVCVCVCVCCVCACPAFCGISGNNLCRRHNATRAPYVHVLIFLAMTVTRSSRTGTCVSTRLPLQKQ
jgi:hypothetical protein